MALLEIYRGETLHVTVDIDERTVYQHKQNAEHKVTAVIVVPSSEAIDFKQGDYIIHDGMRFEINQPVTATKTNQRTIEYEVNFESPVYRLYNLSFIHQGEADFTYLGTLNDYATLIINNMNREDSGWALGVIDDTEPLYMSFLGGDEGYSCRTALTAICDRFGMEFWVSGDGKTLNISKTAGKDTNYDFEVGRSLGLYSLTRRPPDNLQLINRIRPKGSTRNIDFTYRGGARRLKIASDYVETPLEPNELRREGTFIFEDIYPHRNGTIDSVAPDSLSFVDSTLFDINGQKIDGEQAMIVMQSGLLTGEQFEIAGYNHATNTVTINPVTLSNGEIIPNAVTKIQAGDTYTITGIIMPQLYIDQAEEELRVRALELLSQPKNPIYDLEIDEKYVRDNIIVLNTGDRINVRDSEMGIDASIRVTSLEYPLVRPDAITCEISDVIPYSVTERIIIENGKTEQIVREVNVSSAEQARRNMINLRILQEDIFDPDGYLDTTKIRPLSIETAMLAVGVKSQNFGLNNVVIDANTGGDPNLLTITAGQLIHYEVLIEGVGYTWEIPSKSFTLDPAKKYWLFARCSKITLNGTWEISETPILTEDPTYPNAWQFLVGLIYQVNDGRRDFALTNGMTMIVGDTITTGRIKSLDGLNYFDLTQNKFKLGGLTSGLDWNVTSPNRLTILGGGIVQSRGGTVDFIGSYTGNYNNSKSYYLGDIVKYSDGNYYKYINQSVQGVSGIVPTNITYWRISTERGPQGLPGTPGIPGQDGQDGHRGPSLTPRGLWEAGKTYQGTELIVDGVLYGGSWYFAKFNIGTIPAGTLPTNTAYWDPVGAQFESISTGLLLASLAYIENLGARYIQTDIPGEKRIEINERRERKNASGAGTGVWVDQNNVALFAANNTKLAEIDDDSSPGRGVFYLEFNNSNCPPLSLFRGETKERDWSQYNSGSYDSRTGTTGDFSNGFPRFIFDLITQYIGSTRTRYYFRNAEQGFNASDPNADSSLSPNTSIGPTLSNLNNTSMWGAVSRGHTRVLGMESGPNEYQLDGGSVGLNLLDSDIILLDGISPAPTFTMPRFINGGLIDQNVIDRCMYGREVRIINKTTSRVININASGSGDNMFIADGGLETATIGLSMGMTITLKLISKNSVPTSIPNWRWAVILKGYNQYMGT